MVKPIISGLVQNVTLGYKDKSLLDEIISKKKIISQDDNIDNMSISKLPKFDEYYLNKDGVVYGRYSKGTGVLQINAETSIDEIIEFFS